MKLSILIPTVPNRGIYLSRVLNSLHPQMTDGVEILTLCDSREMSIGAKRNRLLEMAKGDYIAFVDDDDNVKQDYISKILKAIESKPDCCGMEGVITFNGRRPRIFIHSLKYDSWFERDNIYFRSPNHLSPVKREIALKVKFKDVSHGEDHDYSKRLLPLLKTEEYIKGAIYHYDFKEVK